MENEYEQMELDTRDQLERKEERLAMDAIQEITAMLHQCPQTRKPIRNRNEAYGVAALNQVRIHTWSKKIKRLMDEFLVTLEDPGYNAALKADEVANAMANAAADTMLAAAEVGRAARDLLAEGTEPDA